MFSNQWYRKFLYSLTEEQKAILREEDKGVRLAAKGLSERFGADAEKAWLDRVHKTIGEDILSHCWVGSDGKLIPRE